MARLVVIADMDTALGFQLAGVEVLRAEDAGSARSKLLQLLSDENVGLIAISSAFLDALDDATRRLVETGYKPVVIGFPKGGPVSAVAGRRERLAALIRRAIGFHITFPGGSEGGPP